MMVSPTHVLVQQETATEVFLFFFFKILLFFFLYTDDPFISVFTYEFVKWVYSGTTQKWGGLSW